MLPSGNDAAVAVGEWGGKIIRKFCSTAQKHLFPKRDTIGQSLNFVSELMVEKKSLLRLFIYHMNKIAKKMNLQNTLFMNAHGLAHNLAYSTAEDVARMTQIAMIDPTFR